MSLSPVVSRSFTESSMNIKPPHDGSVSGTDESSVIFWLYIVIIALLILILGINLIYLFMYKTESSNVYVFPYTDSIYSFFGYNTGGSVSQSIDADEGSHLGIDANRDIIKTGRSRHSREHDPDLTDKLKYDSPADTDVVGANESGQNESKFCRIDAGYCISVTDPKKCMSGNVFSKMEECVRK